MFASSSDTDGNPKQAQRCRRAAIILNVIGVLTGLAVLGVGIYFLTTFVMDFVYDILDVIDEVKGATDELEDVQGDSL